MARDQTVGFQILLGMWGVWSLKPLFLQSSGTEKVLINGDSATLPRTIREVKSEANGYLPKGEPGEYKEIQFIIAKTGNQNPPGCLARQVLKT